MSLAVRTLQSPSPSLAPLLGLTVARMDTADTMAAVQGRSIDQMTARLAAGHRAYMAFLDGQPAAFGWVATRRAEIGELSIAFVVPARHRYLWNFVTLPAFRGRGVYPRLLEAIIEAESVEAETFWIAYAPENHASAAGIHKAGFRTVGQLRYTEAGQPAPCWRCMLGACKTGGCSCDYQRPAASCAGAA